MSADKRINKVSLIVGGRGQGKTDFTKDLIFPLKKKRIICDTFDSPPWHNFKTFHHPEREGEVIPIVSIDEIKSSDKSAVRIVSSDTDAIFDAIQKNAWNSVVVIEDATRFISRQVDANVRKFVLDTKQRNLDLIFIFHSLTDLPPDLIRWSDYLTLFKTNESFTSYLRSKIPNQLIEKAFMKVKSMPQYSNVTIAIGG